jgi:hypothetical protein
MRSTSDRSRASRGRAYLAASDVATEAVGVSPILEKSRSVWPRPSRTDLIRARLTAAYEEAIAVWITGACRMRKGRR